jgi:hypothetical protein
LFGVLNALYRSKEKRGKKKQLCKLIQMMIQYKWREKKKGETDSAGVEELGENY